MKKANPFVLVILVSILLVSCAPTILPVVSVNSSTAVTKLDFSNQSTAIYSVEGLSGQSVFLVKMNVSGSSVPYTQTGNVYSYSLDGRAVSVDEGESDIVAGSTAADSGLASFPSDGGPYRIDSIPAQRYNADPPSPSEVIRLDGMARSVSAVSASSMAAAATNTVGSTHVFNVQNTNTENWTTVTATLMKSGTYCHIWVVGSLDESSSIDNDNKLTSAQITNLADWFDKIYPAETNLIGYEYGGDPALTTTYGGKDEDPKISILVFDINGDYKADQQSGVFGYFTGVDYQNAGYFSIDGDNYFSNGMEMFYIDSYFTDCEPDQMYSTLIHEFQHMINFNQKCIAPTLSGGNPFGVDVPTWYNEMLSMMAEEVVGTSIGIADEGLPWSSRMGMHTYSYSEYGLDTWSYSGNVLYSYAQSYAFGTYLMHNFGGAEVLRKMELNSLTGAASVASAVNAMQNSAVTFADIYRGYPEALLFSSGHENLGHSFYLSDSYSLNGTDYACLPLDIGAVRNPGNNGSQAYYSGVDTVYPKYGIAFRKLNYSWTLPSYGVSVHSDLRLQNVTGSASITVTAPTNPNVEMYIVVR